MNSRETSLMECVKVLDRNRRLVIGVFLSIMVISIGYLLISPKIYETSAIIQVGRSSRNALQPITEVAGRLNNGVYGDGVYAEEIEDIWGVRIYMRSSDPNEDLISLSQVLDQIILEQGTRINSEATLKEKELDKFKKMLDLVNEEAGVLENEVVALRGGYLSSLTQYFAYFQTQERLLGKKIKIAERQYDLETIMKEINDVQFPEVVKSPEISSSPVSPDVRATMVIGFLLGGFLSMFSAFAYEWWRENY